MALASPPTPVQPRIIPRPEHCLSRANVSQNALKVLYRLVEAGFQAFLVGGCVRDLLLQRTPKDFDVATDARPEQVQALFRNCRLIGRRFRLAHVHFGREIIEVATFRAPPEAEGDEVEDDHWIGEHGRLLRDNVYGTIEQDVWRRDFTVNALYYNIADFALWDFTDALADLQAGVIRFIGDPEVRCREDAVRMLRAVRFAAKLGFTMAPSTAAAIHRHGALLTHIAAARLFDEVIKLYHGGSGAATFAALQQYGLFAYLFPSLAKLLASAPEQAEFLRHALANTDARVSAEQPVNPAFLYAALLWPRVRVLLAQLTVDPELPPHIALIAAGTEALAEQLRHTAMPRRYTIQVKEIWVLQPRFERRSGSRSLRLLEHPRFRAAYDFFCLRAKVGEVDAADCRWWTELQAAKEPDRLAMVTTTKGAGKRRRPRRNSKRKAATTPNECPQPEPEP